MKIDLSNRNLKKFDYSFIKSHVNSLSDGEHQVVDDSCIESAIFDNNHLSKLENLDHFLNLKNVLDLFFIKMLF